MNEEFVMDKLKNHDTKINEHDKRLNDIEKNDTKREIMIDNLCQDLKELTSTLKMCTAFSITTLIAVIGFLLKINFF